MKRFLTGFDISCTFHWAQAVYSGMSEIGLQSAYRECKAVHTILKKPLCTATLAATSHTQNTNLKPQLNETS